MKMLRRRSLCLVEFLTVALVFHSSNAFLLMDPGPQFFDKILLPEPKPAMYHSRVASFSQCWQGKGEDIAPSVATTVICDVLTGYESAKSATSFAQTPQFSVTVKDDVRPPEKLSPPSSLPIIPAITRSMTDGRTYPLSTATAPSKSIETANPDSATTSFSAQLSPPTHSRPVGAIVGGTVGGLAIICAAIICLYIWRRRRRRHRGKFLDNSSKLLSIARDPTPAETQEWFSQMHGAMSKVEEQSGIMSQDGDGVKQKQKQSTGIETPAESSELHPISGVYDGSGSIGLTSYIASWRESQHSSGTRYPAHSDSVDSLSLPSQWDYPSVDGVWSPISSSPEPCRVSWDPCS
ncbi:hypothetical protein Hypma_013627 [Hypsizygus marmoreus]|uniref:Mid2 domain-containing protein n=1 Tax=Hypsizygus marmoreus TaxID=39966 RepID=A0A369JBK1_HYPMA|nr:hypothetical protein Hypma_013627 [Hypsizygus marmoreus]